jgi:hypothetical protein
MGNLPRGPPMSSIDSLNEEETVEIEAIALAPYSPLFFKKSIPLNCACA